MKIFTLNWIAHLLIEAVKTYKENFRCIYFILVEFRFFPANSWFFVITSSSLMPKISYSELIPVELVLFLNRGSILYFELFGQRTCLCSFRCFSFPQCTEISLTASKINVSLKQIQVLIILNKNYKTTIWILISAWT